MITSRKITAFTKKVADLPDKTSGALTAAQAKAQFDASPEELRVAHNALIDELGSIATGDSGAHNIGSEIIPGVAGDTVFEQIQSLKQAINQSALGSIPDGSITPGKLSFTTETPTGAQSKANTAEANAKTYVDTNFKQKHKVTADDGRAILLDNGTDLNTVITNGSYNGNELLNAPTSEWYYIEVVRHTSGNGYLIQKAHHLASGRTSFYMRRCEAGTWSSWSADLFSSVDNGKNDLTTAIIGKGGTVAGTSPHSFAELVAGVNTISTGKKMQNGTATSVQTSSFYHKITVSGLVFQPKWVIAVTNPFAYSHVGFTFTSALIIPSGDLMTGAIYNTHMKDASGGAIAQEYWTTQGTAENQFQVTASGFTMIVAKMNFSVAAQSIPWIAFGD